MKDIKDYEGLYAITSCGKVWSYRSGFFLKPRWYKGYLGVVLYKDGLPKPKLIHRLVAEAYLPNPDNLRCVNHKDENKTNNVLTNLEWCTYSYNSRYGTAIQRANEKKYKPVRCIETGECFKSYQEAEKALDIYKGGISDYFYRGQKHVKGYSFELI